MYGEKMRSGGHKLLGDAIKAGNSNSLVIYNKPKSTDHRSSLTASKEVRSSCVLTDDKIGFYEDASSGFTKKKGKPQRLPYVRK